VPTAVIVLDFDPVLRLGDFAVRLETAALAATILVVFVLAARIASRIPAGDAGERTLRPDDLLFIALGIVPGAVIGGRLGYVLLHLDFYRANAGAILDPGRGGLELALGVAGGALSGAYVASLLEGTVGRWFHAAALPLLLGLGFGKLAMALGGSGQGAPADVAWATAYAGDRAWATLVPAIPAHPAQVYEALVALGLVLGLGLLVAVGVLRRPDGRLFLVAVAAWGLGRAVVASTWRDPELLGPLRAGQVLAVLVALGALAGAVAVWRATRRADEADVARLNPHWPDPEAPPPF
jgi:phosphatidylglycerol:prolipoprotein diacylglycerol transferase